MAHKVQIDRELAEIIPAFFSNMENDVAAMRRALAQKDAETMRRLGHGAKGAARGFGFRELGDLGLAIEQASQGAADWTELAGMVDRLESYLSEVEVSYA